VGHVRTRKCTALCLKTHSRACVLHCNSLRSRALLACSWYSTNVDVWHKAAAFFDLFFCIAAFLIF
jgi:hypothetical protein